MHVTARMVRGAPSLRGQLVWGALRGIFRRASEKGFRLLHFSAQGDHLHVIVEADDGVALARGVQRLLSRIAMTANALARRAGSVWRERHHRQVLKKPRQVRNALVYVLFDDRRHQVPGQNGWEVAMASLDPCSSAFWFDGWSPACPPRPPRSPPRVRPWSPLPLPGSPAKAGAAAACSASTKSRGRGERSVQ